MKDSFLLTNKPSNRGRYDDDVPSRYGLSLQIYFSQVTVHRGPIGRKPREPIRGDLPTPLRRTVTPRHPVDPRDDVRQEQEKPGIQIVPYNASVCAVSLDSPRCTPETSQVWDVVV